MRIVRFIADDGRTVIGEDRGDGTATELLDAAGVLGPAQSDRATRFVLRGRRVVIAEDDPMLREMIGVALERFGCTCRSCGDGAEAMAAVLEGDYDLVVSDIVMPHHTGYEIATAVRARHADTPVVLITGFGYDPEHQLVRLSNDQNHTVLFKPFTPQQLVTTLAGALRRNGRGTLVPTTDELAIGPLLAPIVPRDIICIGRNYGDPGTDPRQADPGDLEVFMKPSSTVTDPEKGIRLPVRDDPTPDVTVECELAFIIGMTARHVTEDDAMSHVLGYTIAIDVTDRAWGRRPIPMPWMRGKGFDTFCPLGPAIIGREQLDPHGDVRIITELNGRIIREAPVCDMLRPIPRIIAELTRDITLLPGTIVLTGGPPRVAGVGDDDDRVQAGDTVIARIDPIGSLRNIVI